MDLQITLIGMNMKANNPNPNSNPNPKPNPNPNAKYGIIASLSLLCNEEPFSTPR